MRQMSDTPPTEELQRLAEQAGSCAACGLAATRTTVVFGDGSPHARVMFVGEGPGRNEDLQGLPFVGAAGQLLNRLLSEIGLQRSDTYITNVVKCRPPGNRDPRPDEITACKSYLADQIRLIDPVVVMTLGNFATKLLLAFGICFELPIVITFLARLGIVSIDFLKKNRKYALLLFFIGAAMLTPPDVVTQVMLAGPLMVLYEISILGARLFGRKPQEEQTEEQKNQINVVY